jgi:hypothetical protein
MAKKKKSAKGRRAALKSFARRGSEAYPQKYRTDKELVYGGGKNYKVTADFANNNAGATAADNAGYPLIYINGTLYGTSAGRARAATRASADSAGGDTLDLTIA